MNSIYKTLGILGGATEALQIASEGTADIATIDRILRDQAGFKLGPFELLDLTGIDVAQAAITSFYQQYNHEPRYRPSDLAAQRVGTGATGQKAGKGFYTYVNGVAQVSPEPAVPTVAELPPVWVSSRAVRRAELYQLLKDLGAKIETGTSPSAQALSIVSPLGFDVTTVAIVERLDPARTIGIDLLIDDKLTRRRVLATNPATRADMRDAAQADAAITEDWGYPMSPLKMGDLYGPTEILEVLFNVQTVYGDTRYRPSPWLRRRGALGLSLLHTEN